jgi:hypothetical protein
MITINCFYFPYIHRSKQGKLQKISSKRDINRMIINFDGKDSLFHFDLRGENKQTEKKKLN